eukprot:91815-Amphidinium_carterae.1
MNGSLSAWSTRKPLIGSSAYGVSRLSEDPKIVCHPVLVMMSDLIWAHVCCRRFAKAQSSNGKGHWIEQQTNRPNCCAECSNVLHRYRPRSA